MPRDEFGLEHAVRRAGLNPAPPEYKAYWRGVAMSGRDLPPGLPQGLMDYCLSDVAATEAVLLWMIPHLDHPRCLIRGRFTKATASVESTGLPLDVAYYRKLTAHWPSVRRALIERRGHGLFVAQEVSRPAFERFLDSVGMLHTWPRTPTGLVSLDANLLEEQAPHHPILQDVSDLRAVLKTVPEMNLPIGSDGWARHAALPGIAKTGRCLPLTRQFIFQQHAWTRFLIKPPEGWAVACLDYEAEEFAIAAALSSDERMMWAYNQGDPYMGTAILAGSAPTGATKASHPRERKLWKVASLADLYGQGATSLASGLGVSVDRAREIKATLQRLYPQFCAWRENTVLTATIRNYQETALGWRTNLVHGREPNPCGLMNYPIQGTGADVLRVAAILAFERGVKLAATVHDSLVLVDKVSRIREAVETCRAAMIEAGQKVLQGFTLRVDLKSMLVDDGGAECPGPVVFPGRFFDEGGFALWKDIRDLCPP
ncbi:MAG: DNA polymerase [Limisphaerales bacterium]